MLVLSVAAAAVILAGPGRYGFDGGRGWARRPFIGSFLALLLGIGGGVAAWLFLRGTIRSAEPEQRRESAPVRVGNASAAGRGQLWERRERHRGE